jgi:hypothetical protein
MTVSLSPHPEAPADASAEPGVSKGEAMGYFWPWFETRRYAALLTMRPWRRRDFALPGRAEHAATHAKNRFEKGEKRVRIQ